MENDLKDTPIVSVGGSSITVGDIQDIVPDADPNAIIRNAVKIKGLVDEYGEAALTAASLIPYVRIGLGARAGMAGVAKAVGKSELTKAAGKEALKNINILPGTAGEKHNVEEPVNRKKRKNVGERIPVVISNKTHSLPIKNVLPSGYEVDASEIPGNKPGQTMTVPEPL